MKNKDQILLEKAYESIYSSNEVALDEKNNLKGALMGVALGAAALGNADAYEKGAMEPSDFADKAAIEYANAPEPSYNIDPNDAADEVIKRLHLKQKISSSLLKVVAKDKDASKRCAYMIIMKGHELPDILRKVVGDYDKEIKASLQGP